MLTDYVKVELCKERHPNASCATVAACLMLRASLLDGVPGVLRTYLRYHLLAPAGPRVDRVFLFLDDPPSSEPATQLKQWVDEADGAIFRQQVTLLDGQPAASMEANTSSWPPARDKKVRAAASGGELIAKQVLNMQRALDLAASLEIDWLICNLDIDEALVARMSIGETLACVPADIDQLVILNHEVVPETHSRQDYFELCTFTKRNPSDVVAEATEEKLNQAEGADERRKAVMRCIDFWATRAHKAQVELEGACARRGAHFLAYTNGKSAIRVGRCRDGRAYPLGSHRWQLPGISLNGPEPLLEPRDCHIMHYVFCGGLESFTERYQARKGESWNTSGFHCLCQRALSKSPEALGSLFRSVVMLPDTDNGAEEQRQLESRLCYRSNAVRDALVWTDLNCMD